MTRFAVASDFEGICRFYTGTSTDISLIDGVPTNTASRSEASTFDHATATQLADTMTNYCGQRAATARTWFVMGLPESRK